MMVEHRRPNGFAGWTLIASSALFLLRAILDFMAGPFPATGQDILSWLSTNRTLLAFANEALFFAAVLMIPAVVQIYRSLADRRPELTTTGCGLLAMTIPILAVLDILHGRLVYPIFGIRIHTAETAELIVTLFYGGLHMVGIIFGAATILLSLSMRQSYYGTFCVVFGYGTAVADFIGAYPFVIGPIATIFCQIIFTVWFLMIGWKLTRQQ